MFKVLWKVIRTLLAGITSIAILSGFTILYCNSGVHITNTSGATDYTWEPNQLKTNMTEGISWMRMDSCGFNNAYISDEPVSNLLMGSSHMEAVNINKNKNLGYLLNSRLPGRTYNIGISGHQIYNCVRNMADAVEEYKPEDYIFLETDRVELDIESMKEVLSNTYPRIPSYDTGLIYKIQKYLPVIKSIYNQVSIWRDTSETDAENITDAGENAENELSDEYIETLDSFLAYAAQSAGKAKLIIFFHPETSIDTHGNLIIKTDQSALEAFSKTCRSNGIIFVDMTDSFMECYESEQVLPHGFINTAIGTGHLNETGHALIADELADVIGGMTQCP